MLAQSDSIMRRALYQYFLNLLRFIPSSDERFSQAILRLKDKAILYYCNKAIFFGQNIAFAFQNQLK
jgi:hypothetical protein